MTGVWIAPFFVAGCPQQRVELRQVPGEHLQWIRDFGLLPIHPTDRFSTTGCIAENGPSGRIANPPPFERVDVGTMMSRSVRKEAISRSNRRPLLDFFIHRICVFSLFPKNSNSADYTQLKKISILQPSQDGFRSKEADGHGPREDRWRS